MCWIHAQIVRIHPIVRFTRPKFILYGIKILSYGYYNTKIYLFHRISSSPCMCRVFYNAAALCCICECVCALAIARTTHNITCAVTCAYDIISLCINILLWLSYHTEPICVYVRICYVIYIYYFDGIMLAYLSCFVIMYELIRDKMFLGECTQANIWIMSRRRRIRRYFAREHMKSYTLIKFASKPKLIELGIATAPAVLFLCLNISKRYSNLHNEYDYWLL